MTIYPGVQSIFDKPCFNKFQDLIAIFFIITSQSLNFFNQ